MFHCVLTLPVPAAVKTQQVQLATPSGSTLALNVNTNNNKPLSGHELIKTRFSYSRFKSFWAFLTHS